MPNTVRTPQPTRVSTTTSPTVRSCGGSGFSPTYTDPSRISVGKHGTLSPNPLGLSPVSGS